jgi:hypothetical protein
MSTYRLERADRRLAAVSLRVVVVTLALATAAFHLTLGGLLFTMNAAGYGVLAVAMVLPGPVARHRWLVRIALIGFTLATIGGWLMFGARYPLAYFDKGLEALLVVAIVGEIWLVDGGPVAVATRLRGLFGTVARAIGVRA